ncbi:MAG: Fe-S cluster assembly protein SufD [Gammaproteobacteria bacterium]
MNAFADNLSEQFRQHAEHLPGGDKDNVAAFRRRAFSQFEAVGLPTLRHEDWKYTDIRAIAKASYAALGGHEQSESSDISLDALPFPSFAPHLAVFLDGDFCPALSRLDALPDCVQESNIHALLQHDPERIVGQVKNYDAAFPSLNSALMKDGLLVEVSAGATVTEPIQVLNISRAGGLLNTARLMLNAGANSAVTIIETHYSLEGSTSMTNALTEIEAQAGAQVTHYRIQMDNSQCHHIGNVIANVQADAHVRTYSFAFGGDVTRIDVNADLVGKGANVTMNGLFMVDDDQHIDHHTRVRHCVSHTQSNENYKGIADGNGRGVFNGKILVDQDAQKIDAIQSSKNLLLSDNAEIDTKPELEIYADDVKCAHSATVGQLDDDAFFYLRSRGVEEAKARSMLTFAFAADIAEDVDITPVREWLEEIITSRTHASGINEIGDDG